MKKIVNYAISIVLSLQTACTLSMIEKIELQSQNLNPQALLIFLDDSEHELGAITNGFLAAYMKEAGPILVSASLIANLRSAKIPDEKDPQKLHERAEEIAKIYYAAQSEEEEQEYKDIIMSAIPFDADANNWVIKEINQFLYLLIPKKYILTKNIDSKSIEAFNPKGPLTSAEYIFGLKINHLKTVAITDIKKPEQVHEFADYFVDSLNTIFITNREYPTDKKNLIPAWSIFIDGHGGLNYSIAWLSLQQFKDFLNFLEKIKTRLFVYASCYAAGTNANLMYKDAKTGVDKTHSFAIITQALTDAYSSSSVELKTDVINNRLTVDINVHFDTFVSMITAPDIIHYREAIAVIAPEKTLTPESIPQIKYPGLPWFSILAQDKAVSIGSIMVKTRTAPLDIATFFAKKGVQSEPLGILLYTQDIPFELIINTQGEAPIFVSMIPGNALHFIKKISSTNHDAEAILSSFYLEGLIPRKMFIIDEIEASFGEELEKILQTEEGLLQNVIIDSTEKETLKYFTYLDKIYRATGDLLSPDHVIAEANENQKTQYRSLLRLYGKSEQPIASSIVLEAAHKKAQELFSQTMTPEQAEEAISNILDQMPDSAVVYIPKIIGASCPTDKTWCWFDLIDNLMNYKPIKPIHHKILYINTIETCTKTEDWLCYPYNDIIIDATNSGTKIFYKDSERKNPKSFSKTSNWTLFYKDLPMDYMLIYEQMFQYFEKNRSLDKSLENKITDLENRATHEPLTAETIAKIRQVQEKKIAEQKNR